MGGLEVSNKALRCLKCLEIKRMTVCPEYPEPKLKIECRCDEKETKLFDFLNEYKKKENFKIKCAKCQNDNPKEPIYCYSCQKIYCLKCSDFHSQLSSLTINEKEENNKDIMTIIGHKTISIEKVDFHCVLHENEKFIGFCKKCLLNFCQKCQDENLHNDHEISLFSEILLDAKKKSIIKGNINLCQEKMEHNEKMIKKIKKKLKNEESKNQISTLSKENKKINEKILEFFELMLEIYDKTKNKNYSIIFNARKNTKFNTELYLNGEEDIANVFEYLKNDFILHSEINFKNEKEAKENNELENKQKRQNIISNNKDINKDNKSLENKKEDKNEGKEINDNHIEIKQNKEDNKKIQLEKNEEKKE